MITLTRWPPPGSRDVDKNGPLLTEKQIVARQAELNLWEVKLYGRRVGWVGTPEGQKVTYLPWVELTPAEKARIEEHVRNERARTQTTAAG